MDTIEKLEKNDCCGCSACCQKCPKEAITMQENEEGFIYPVIDKEKCINCGLCVKVCPQLKHNNDACSNPTLYALVNKNDSVLRKSSSGGVFTEIAKCVLKNEGYVFGAAYDNQFKVIHTGIDNENDLLSLNKSKYVQSDINNSYKTIEKYLKENKLVFFSGTPCQVNGLKKYLGNDYDNLITCDIVCHGVPSYKAFLQYLKLKEKKEKSKVKNYDFRNKDIDGVEKIGKIEFCNGKTKYIKTGLDNYYNNFLCGNLFRKSCYQCHYSNLNRVGDITIGDYIGVKSVQPEAYCSKGTSICIVNSTKGMEIFEGIKDSFLVYETEYEKIKKFNMNLEHAKEKPFCRDIIYKNIDNYKKFNKDLNKYMNKKWMIKSLVPNTFKRILKQLGGK